MALLIPRSWLTTECIEAAEGRPAKKPGLTVMKWPFVERWIARAHPAFPIVWAAPLGVFMIHLSLARGVSLLQTLALVGAGWLGFSLVEYVLHRVLFHRTFPDTPDGRLDAFLTHGYHHVYPNDRTRLVMPPMIAWPLGLLFWGVLRLALGPTLAPGAFTGVLLGYVAYDWIHFYTHHARPTTRLGRWIRRYHLLHHHDEHGSRFGVSSPLWDLVFGTFRSSGYRAPRPGRHDATA